MYSTTARFRTLAAVAIPAACMAQAAFGAHPKLARDLDSVFAGDLVNVIVQYKPEGFKRLNGAMRTRYANIGELTAKGLCGRSMPRSCRCAQEI